MSIPAIRFTEIYSYAGTTDVLSAHRTACSWWMTDQVVNAVDAVVASGKKLAVRSGGHLWRGLSTIPPSSA